MTKPYDLARAVADFRATMESIGTATTAAERKKLEAEAQRMRDAYKAWNGDDELFELAYATPDE